MNNDLKLKYSTKHPFKQEYLFLIGWSTAYEVIMK